MHLDHVVTHVVQIAGGLLLLVGGVTSVEIRWVGRAIALSGLAFVAAGGLKLALELGALHGAAEWGHWQLGASLGGFGAGGLVTLFLAGELKLERLRRRKRA